MKKRRLDEILMEEKVVNDKKEAFVKITEGYVFINGQKAVSPAQMINQGVKIEIREKNKYVGRGALKLEAAIEKFGIDVQDKVCADIGAATGGFTEILLKNGAKKVYAIDTARGKLALKLREDPRVVVIEKTDVRDLEELPEVIDCIVIDVSLISLREILPAVRSLMQNDGIVIALLKPQYEVRDQKVLRKGIVTGVEVREGIRREMILWTKNNGWRVEGWIESPIRGGEGNIEYFLFLKKLAKKEN
jgi:23S rRNA (cytidine1920-2'-O)/16S rRNA (cytidine1409-2'-O)-methyltransferase